MTHPVELLPWYRNGTLSQAERASVSAHLESCAECRAELASLREVHEQVHDALESDAAPSAAARRRVLANIAQARNERSAPGRRTAPRSTVFDSIAEVFRALMAPKWVPTAAVMIIAVQGGLLLWSSRPPDATPPPQPDSRTLKAPSVRIHVQFVATASEAQIRELLTELRGHIVDGPRADGTYELEVLANDAAHAAAKLERLRARSDLVRHAEGVTQ